MHLLNFIICIFAILVPFVSGSNVTENNKMKNITDFFPDTKGNLTKITWAHAVNSVELLQTSLKSKVMMLEADVILGSLTNSSEIIPIMAHPPATTSDLSFEKFVHQVQDFNSKDNNIYKKGIKLDFKTIEAMDHSNVFLKDIFQKVNFPIWLNADILKGPLDSQDPPVDAKRFLAIAKNYSTATLSIGWRTQYGNNITKASYTDAHINEMITLITTNNVTQLVTFPVRAGIAAQSIAQMHLLVDNVTSSTLTVWSSDGDHVDVELLRNLIQDIGTDRIYIDVPEDLLQKLNLDGSSGVNTVKPILVLSLLLLVIVQLF